MELYSQDTLLYGQWLDEKITHDKFILAFLCLQYFVCQNSLREFNHLINLEYVTKVFKFQLTSDANNENHSQLPK
jgi:hypothetical protein